MHNDQCTQAACVLILLMFFNIGLTVFVCVCVCVGFNKTKMSKMPCSFMSILIKCSRNNKQQLIIKCDIDTRMSTYKLITVPRCT